MSFELIALLVAGAAAGGFINGLAGFGTALMALGLWLQILPPWQAVAIAAAMSVISGVQSIWLIRKEMRSGIRRVPRFLLPALIGIPLGAAVLERIDPTPLKIALAGFMLLYGLFFMARRALPTLRRERPLADGLVGFLGGFLGGAASLSGALPTMWCAMHPWSKGETSAVLQPYNVVILGLSTAVFAWRGYYTRETLLLMAIALPATLISSQIGTLVFRRLSDAAFRRLLIWLLFGAGLLLAIREAF
ncbi:sulfite exporter TauE/SafE family protein [Paracoccus aminophilus]|uniref:Probable membrane transporter protein n=1 Tax=Paracoccus aminophilus JCM 7686 TaxID=1367847 RepID=S5YAR4_PARAH|nr:sulfite exporter TauE/SafE family protein [Paracoccus aminophilus]AGT08513.1 hypothetical protein JCM7686_1412 [Paracoccus aminophilus JCM 7686]